MSPSSADFPANAAVWWLETERLLLRPFLPEDTEPFAVICADPRVMEHYPRPWSREEAEGLLLRQRLAFEERAFSLYAVIPRGESQLIGYCGHLLQEIPRQSDGALEPVLEVGYMLHADFWGRGLATEAARACRDDAFQRLEVDEVVSLILPQNHRSQRVAIKNGMRHQRDTTFRQLQVRVYAIHRREWDELARRPPEPTRKAVG